MQQKFEMQLTLSGIPFPSLAHAGILTRSFTSAFSRVFDRPVAFTGFWMSQSEGLDFSAPKKCYYVVKESRGCQVLVASLWPLWDALSKNPGWTHVLNNSNNRSDVYTVGWSTAICYAFMGQVNERKMGNDYSSGAWINLSPFSRRPGNIWLLQIIFNHIGHAIKVNGFFCE